MEVELIMADRDALQLWQKGALLELKGERSKRVSALILLFNLDLDSAKRHGTRYGWMVSNSLAVAAGYSKSPRWAESLRHWRQDWEQSCIPPPDVRLARNQSWKSLYSDEGIKLVVRTYLNREGAKANTTGLTLAINEVLRTRRIAGILDAGAGAGSAGCGSAGAGSAGCGNAGAGSAGCGNAGAGSAGCGNAGAGSAGAGSAGARGSFCSL